ncbi:MAG: hypothetical protein KAS32_20665, partial [Candidatus Peribacteraceae bacterium]|nr:hypothetical protein [Candidatus Peribacteraceae bacterium]
MKKIPILLIALISISGYSQYIVDGNYTLGRSYNPFDSAYVADIIVSGTATIATLDYEPPHASFGFSDSSVTITMSQNDWVVTTNAWYDIFDVSSSSGMTVAGDTVTIVTDGDYMTSVSISFSGSNTDVYEFAIFKNGAVATPKMERSTSSTDIGNVSLPFYLQGLNAGDDLSMRIRNTGNNNDVT